MRFILKDDGYPWKVIYQARKNVGRVYRHTDGRWVGKIGPLERFGATAAQAFDEVCAAEMGYANAATLRSRNRQVTQRKRMVNSAMNQVADAYLHSDTETQLGILDKAFKNPQALPCFLDAVTRRLFK